MIHLGKKWLFENSAVKLLWKSRNLFHSLRSSMCNSPTGKPAKKYQVLARAGTIRCTLPYQALNAATNQISTSVLAK